MKNDFPFVNYIHKVKKEYFCKYFDHFVTLQKMMTPIKIILYQKCYELL